jgi:hypothetical protein
MSTVSRSRPLLRDRLPSDWWGIEPGTQEIESRIKKAAFESRLHIKWICFLGHGLDVLQARTFGDDH